MKKEELEKVEKNAMSRRSFLKTAGAAAAAAGTSGIFAPAILKAAKAPIKIGHLVPLTGFLSPMGDYGRRPASWPPRRSTRRAGARPKAGDRSSTTRPTRAWACRRPPR